MCVCARANIGFVDGMNVYITHFVSVSLGCRQGTVRKLRCCSNITRVLSDVNYFSIWNLTSVSEQEEIISY